jgi:hypothetical protein
MAITPINRSKLQVASLLRCGRSAELQRLRVALVSVIAIYWLKKAAALQHAVMHAAPGKYQ